MAGLENKNKEEILKTPINQLGLDVSKAEVNLAVEDLYKELDGAGIKFHPPVYLTDSWGCPDGVPVIGVPFYLADPKLIEIEKERIGIVDEMPEIQQILRHEAGHAFNYAYSLYKLPKWKEIFGVYDKPYEDNFAPIFGNSKFVRHLEGWYAQKHPDEDFAETFALIITPGFDWRVHYKGTKAYKKLVYTNQLIKEFKDKPVYISNTKLDVPVESIEITLDDWYRSKLAQPKDKKKVLVLFYQEYPKKMPTHDEVVDQIKEVLLSLNFSVVLLPINQSIERIVNGIRQEKPDLIFNLCETFRNNDRFEFNVTALLEMLRIPFTGSGSGSMFLSNDKYISKKIFDFHKISYPNFFIVKVGQEMQMPSDMTFPLFAKPVHEDASIGIDDKSVVNGIEELKAKVSDIHQTINDDVLVEEYIDGREFFVSILGNGKIVRPLEIVELDFSRWPQDKPKIYTHKAKVEEGSAEYKLIGSKIPTDINLDVKNKIYELALKVYFALGATDYARIDIRMDKNGKFYVLEANLNPYLAKSSETTFAAQASGLNYQQLIEKIIEASLSKDK